LDTSPERISIGDTETTIVAFVRYVLNLLGYVSADKGHVVHFYLRTGEKMKFGLVINAFYSPIRRQKIYRFNVYLVGSRATNRLCSYNGYFVAIRNLLPGWQT
jgi:hypothetical protein